MQHMPILMQFETVITLIYGYITVVDVRILKVSFIRAVNDIRSSSHYFQVKHLSCRKQNYDLLLQVNRNRFIDIINTT